MESDVQSNKEKQKKGHNVHTQNTLKYYQGNNLVEGK